MSEDLASSGAYTYGAPSPYGSGGGIGIDRTPSWDFVSTPSGVVRVNAFTGEVQLAYPAAPSGGRAPSYSFQVNPQTGELIKFSDSGQMIPTGLSWSTPESVLRQFDEQTRREAQMLQRELQENEQRFQSLESAAAQRQALLMHNSSMEYQSESDYLARVQRASEFAQQAARDQAEVQLAHAQLVQSMRDSWMARRATARVDLANFITSPNSAAHNAYLTFGGGDLSNALANPNAPSLLSDRAMIPAASAYEATHEPEPTPPPMPVIPSYNFQPQRAQVQAIGNVGTGAILDPRNVGWPAGYGPNGPTGGGGGASGPNYASQYGAGTWSAGNSNTGFVGSVDAGGNLVATPTAAQGGTFTNRVITGDSPDGRENRELVEVIGDMIRVTPLDHFNAPVRNVVARTVPKAAEGGVYATSPSDIGSAINAALYGGSTTTRPTTPSTPNYVTSAGLGPSDGSLSPETQSLIDQLRRWRQNYAEVPLQALGVNSQFDPRFHLLGPVARQQWAYGRQTVTGAPADEFLWEAQRYALPGVQRGAGYLGI